MTDKMLTHHASDLDGPYEGSPQTDTAKDCFFASGCVGVLALLAYSLVNFALTNSRDPSQPDVELVIGYILIILGYLLLPGVGVILVRRKRCLARNRALLLAETDSADASFIDAFVGVMPQSGGLFGTRQISRDVDRCSKCVTWGAADAEEVQCSVCLSEVEQGCEARVLPCSHVFHKQCADLWLVNGRNNSCPMCLGRVVDTRDSDMIPIRR